VQKLLKDSRFWIGVGISALGVVSIALVISFWDSLTSGSSETISRSETIRNLALIIGGFLAFVFALWRARVAGYQADAARGQVETARQGLLNERYQRGAEMLGSGVLAVRLGGIYALQQLASQHAETYHVQIMRLFCAFIRNPPKDDLLDKGTYFEGEWHSPVVREDVQAAITAIGTRNVDHIRLETESGFVLDLRRARLKLAHLQHHRLDRANLSSADFHQANLEGVSLENASLDRADLSSSNLTSANLRGSSCSHVIAHKATAVESNLKGANLEGSLWSHANLEGSSLSSAILKGVDLTGAKLAGADVSCAAFGVGSRRFDDYQLGMMYTRQLYTSLTQAQLNEAVVSGGRPPRIPIGTKDSQTDAQLVWQIVCGH